MSVQILEPKAEEMGRVVISATIENLTDLWRAQTGEIPADAVRSIEVSDALVDTGCVGLGVPKRYIAQLGLNWVRTRRVRTTNGPRDAGVYEIVRLTIQERTCAVEVYDLPDSCPVLIGQVPLEILDFVVDMPSKRLVGNPEHDGEWMMDMF